MNFKNTVLFPYNALVTSLFPKKCMGCGEIIKESEDFCYICKHSLEIINPKKRCKFCGNDRDACTCKKRVYYFKNIVCVYRNDGVAKTALYKYKLARKEHYADFFADRMAEAVNKEFSGVEFSAVTCVPTSMRSKMRRGFDHSRLLAEKISERLETPFVGDVIKVKKFMKSQHKSRGAQRFDNVTDKYYFSKRLNAENVLLVDDIKTTGASLDSCAKQLLLAGVENVYCVTALSTYYIKKKVEKVKKK